MANGLSGIKLGVHGVTRIEIRQERGESFKWLTIALISQDGTEAHVTAFCDGGWPELSLARDYAPQTGREADSLHNASERYEPKTTDPEETTREETNGAV